MTKKRQTCRVSKLIVSSVSFYQTCTLLQNVRFYDICYNLFLLQGMHCVHDGVVHKNNTHSSLMYLIRRRRHHHHRISTGEDGMRHFCCLHTFQLFPCLGSDVDVLYNQTTLCHLEPVCRKLSVSENGFCKIPVLPSCLTMFFFHQRRVEGLRLSDHSDSPLFSSKDVSLLLFFCFLLSASLTLLPVIASSLDASYHIIGGMDESI